MRCSALSWNDQTGSFVGEDDIKEASFVLFFGDRSLISDPSVSANLRERFPSAQILGCTTGTVVDGSGIYDRKATAVAVKLDRSDVRLASASLSETGSRGAGQDLANALAGPGLVGVLLLSDGLAVNGVDLVAGMQDVLGPALVIGGGLAGDGPHFGQTLVAANGYPVENQVAALGFYGEGLTINIGVGHGWDYFGPNRRITRSDSATLYELDGKPALELYKRYLGDEAADLPASALLYPLMISNPLDPSDEVIRTVLSVDHGANSMTFAGDIPEGWSARLMRGAFDRLVQGAASAALQTRNDKTGGQPGLAVVISCVGRRLLLDQRTEDEIEAVAALLPENYVQTGFYSYGEIATKGAGRCSLHNETLTLFTLEEAA